MPEHNIQQTAEEAYEAMVGRLSELLKKRAVSYPWRDRHHAELMGAVDEFVGYLLRTSGFRDFKPEPERLAETARFENSPLFVCGAMRSGTTLLTQLLDGHPQLFVMPSDSFFARPQRTWERTAFEDIARHWIQRMVNPSGQEPFWFLGPERAAFDRFLGHLHFLLNTSDKNVFVCVMLSAFLAHPPRSPRVAYWVEKTPHNELDYRILTERFPNAKFLHVIRDPLANVVSLKKLYGTQGWEFSGFSIARLLRKLFRAGRANLKRHGADRYRFVRYEDLVAEPRRSIEEICRFLGIEYDEVLLTPTVNGKPGTSNSMFADARVHGRILDSRASPRHEQELTAEELREVVTLLYGDALRFGYDWRRAAIARYRKPLWVAGDAMVRCLKTRGALGRRRCDEQRTDR